MWVSARGAARRERVKIAPDGDKGAVPSGTDAQARPRCLRSNSKKRATQLEAQLAVQSKNFAAVLSDLQGKSEELEELRKIAERETSARHQAEQELSASLSDRSRDEEVQGVQAQMDSSSGNGLDSYTCEYANTDRLSDSESLVGSMLLGDAVAMEV
jgi:hypothetical protein